MRQNDRLVFAMVISLNGDWLLGTDPQNVGRERQWWTAPTQEAKPARVPWIIQDAFPGYHGVAWYWRDFSAPRNPSRDGRYLLRFWAVDYKADVWVNGTYVGAHEGGETPFVLHVTGAVKPGRQNRLAVRVLNPTHEPIDGIVLNETPHRNKALPYTAGSDWDHGGIVDSVELLVAPAVRIEDLFARPDAKTGRIRVQADVRNAGAKPVKARVELTVAPAATGETLDVARLERDVPVGDTLIEAELQVASPHLWDLNDPFLYRVTARMSVGRGAAFDEQSVRCGFRDFRFERGGFRLNGRRVFLRCSHTGNCCPIGLHLPHDPDLLRRDLLNVKVMGFSAIRFIAGLATRDQLDLCDEIGLMVYEESYAGWCLADSPKMAERFDRSTAEMIRRDRNHPSIVIWGLLNETPDGPVFRHAAASLPLVRSLDDSRMVMLNSGRWDAQQAAKAVGLEVWRTPAGPDPNVTRNPTGRPIAALGITWAPGQLAFHPGPAGEYSAIRWTAPPAGEYGVAVSFAGIAERATTDVHVLHNERSLFDGLINVGGRPNATEYEGKLACAGGDTLDFVVGFGNGNYGGDTTALHPVITLPDGEASDAASEFSVERNPNGSWSYGHLASGPAPDATTFMPYPVGETLEAEPGTGSLSNPGSTEWEDVLSDQHQYPRVPHTAATMRLLRNLNGGGNPVFLSEYGIGSAVDLVRVARHYEQLGAEDAEDARFYRGCLDRFLADWDAWRLEDAFGTPEALFAQSLAKMAGQRALGINAIRANPNIVGYSLTGTVDQGMTGEGLFTTFRELKPGTTDALFDGLAPLRWCLFAEPVNVYRGATVRLEAVLASEDALPPGDYPVRLRVIGPGQTRVLDRTVTVTIPARDTEPPFALPAFSEDLVVDAPAGKYRFVAAFERGGAATGGEAEFQVADPAEMPPVDAEVVLWGDDPDLAKWLTDHGIRARAFTTSRTRREVILAFGVPPPDAPMAYRELAKHVARGSTVVFLSPEALRRGEDPVGWLPLAEKGTLIAIAGWLYLKDEWAKEHPIFDGLPSGGLMDYAYYREIIPDLVWQGREAPPEAVAGAIKSSQDYSSGLMVSAWNLGAGRLILNTLLIRENLGSHPAAERLLRNMLRYAARDMAEPLTDLPEDFDARLKEMGYE